MTNSTEMEEVLEQKNVGQALEKGLIQARKSDLSTNSWSSFHCQSCKNESCAVRGSPVDGNICGLDGFAVRILCFAAVVFRRK
jgi:hypothetical protein